LKQTGKRGYTIIEVVVTLAIVSVIGGFLVHFAAMHIDNYNRSYAMTETKYLCGTLFDLLEPELRYGKDFTVTADGSLRYRVVEEDGSEEIKICAGSYDEHDFIPENYQIIIFYTADAAGEWVRLRICAYEEDDLLYEQTAFIRSLYSKTR
jgi:prepilin-type N-terminal cleavage/methylation domain